MRVQGDDGFGKVSLLWVMLLLLASPSAWAGSEAKDSATSRMSTAAVLDFQGRGVGENDPKVLSDRFRFELFQRHAYRLLERSEMDKVLKEQGFQKSGACDQQECAVEVGKLLGVRCMVVGTVNRIGTTWTVAVRVIDVETGEILQSAVLDRKGDIDGLLKPGMAELAAKLQGEGGNEASATDTAASGTERSLLPQMDFGKVFHDFGKTDPKGHSTLVQVGFVPPIQLVEETRVVNALALSLPYSRNAAVTGLQAGIVNEARWRLSGAQLGVVNLGGKVSFLQMGVFSKAQSFMGLQAGVLNVADDAQGIQIGFLNYARKLHGVQIGFLNIALQGAVFPVFPLVNGSF